MIGQPASLSNMKNEPKREQRIQAMLEHLRSAYADYETKHGTPNTVSVHPDLYDSLQGRWIAQQGIGWVVDGAPMVYRKAKLLRAKRQDALNDLHTKFTQENENNNGNNQ